MSGSGAEPSRLRGEDRLNAKAGEGARAKAAELAAGKSKLRRFAERALDVPTEERNWRKGAKGEEVVGGKLDRLTERGWAVVHDLTIGTRGANLDHLVIGPAGIFTINTKHLSGKVTLYERALLINGQKTDYLPKAVREADQVQRALSRSLGRAVHVWPLIVLMGCELHIKGRPGDVTIVGRRQLPRWFLKLPGTGLDARSIAEIEAAARDLRTWPAQGSAKAAPGRAATPVVAEPPRQPTPSPPASAAWSARSPAQTQAPPPPASPAVPAPPTDGPGTPTDLTITRWRRFGHDRVYVNGTDGKSIGFLDLLTGQVHVEDERDRSRITERLEQPDVPSAGSDA